VPILTLKFAKVFFWHSGFLQRDRRCLREKTGALRVPPQEAVNEHLPAAVIPRAISGHAEKIDPEVKFNPLAGALPIEE
jgi:hypothetical protein